MRTLITPGKNTDFINLELADLELGDSLASVADGEVPIVILGGVLDVAMPAFDPQHAWVQQGGSANR